jgi:hypothetical protein
MPLQGLKIDIFQLRFEEKCPIYAASVSFPVSFEKGRVRKPA